MNSALADIDALLTPNNIGVLALRPAFGQAGQTYLATDATTGPGTTGNANGTLYLDIGTAWIPIHYEGPQAYWRIQFDYTVNYPVNTGAFVEEKLAFLASGSDPLRLSSGISLPALTGPTAPPGIVQIGVPGVYRLSFSMTVQDYQDNDQVYGACQATLAVQTAASSYATLESLASDALPGVGPATVTDNFVFNATDTVRLALNDYVFTELLVIIGGFHAPDYVNAYGTFSGEWIAP
jgi:hypothetical protein